MMIEPKIPHIGAALSDQSRATMLCTLMDGRAYTNNELALDAGITAQTASAHLKLLQQVGLTKAFKSGRCLYHSIANQEVAHLLEQIGNLAPSDHLNERRHHKQAGADILFARSCYDHLAGRLGVLLTKRLVELRVFSLEPTCTTNRIENARPLEDLGIDIKSLRDQKRPLVRSCLDWTERRKHLSGAVGSALLDRCLNKGWLERQKGRGLNLTANGKKIFQDVLGLDYLGALDHD